MGILKLPVQVAESVLSIGGIRIGTEEPHYVGTPLSDRVELRRYGPRIAAETTVAADEDRARNIGFRRLANYIFGGQPDRNRDDGAVLSSRRRTSRRSGVRHRWTIRFFMPSKWTMETLPTPDDDNVALVTVPGETVAVLRFSWRSRRCRSGSTHRRTRRSLARQRNRDGW